MNTLGGSHAEAQAATRRERFGWFHVACAWVLLALSWAPPAAEVLELVTPEPGADLGWVPAAALWAISLLILLAPTKPPSSRQ